MTTDMTTEPKQLNLTTEDFAIFQRVDSTTECNYWQADRADAAIMSAAQRWPESKMVENAAVTHIKLVR